MKIYFSDNILKIFKSITYPIYHLFKKYIGYIFQFITNLYQDIKNIDENDLEKFKSIVKRVASILLVVWLVILFVGILFNSVDDKGNVGIVGDAMNIVTSLTGVFTVALLAYAVYLQKKELNEVRIQISEQTKSTEKEQKINRTLNYLEEWEGAWNEHQKSENNYLLENDDPAFINSDVFNFIENLMYKNQINEIKDKYIDILLLVKAIKSSCLIPEIDKTIQYIENRIKTLKKPTPRNYSMPSLDNPKELIIKYERTIELLKCYKEFIDIPLTKGK